MVEGNTLLVRRCNYEGMKELFTKYLSNKLSPAQTVELMNWLDTEEGKKLLEVSLIEEWDELGAENVSASAQEKAAIFIQVLSTTNLTKKLQPIPRKRSLPQRTFYYSVVASLLAIVLLAGVYVSNLKVNSNQYIITINTQKERRKIVLPDNSEVVLYENSTLSYNNFWNKAADRNVYLQGNAFFKVQHPLNNTSFTVHTADSLDVLVAGTEFEVSSVNDKSQIILINGKVNISINKASVKMKQVLMPGDMISIDYRTSTIGNKKVDAALYTGRRKAAFDLAHTSLLQLAQMLQDVYGYQVQLPASAVVQEEFSGTLPNGRLEDILDAITKLTGLNHSVEAKVITFYL